MWKPSNLLWVKISYLKGWKVTRFLSRLGLLFLNYLGNYYSLEKKNIEICRAKYNFVPFYYHILWGSGSFFSFRVIVSNSFLCTHFIYLGVCSLHSYDKKKKCNGCSSHSKPYTGNIQIQIVKITSLIFQSKYRSFLNI